MSRKSDAANNKPGLGSRPGLLSGSQPRSTTALNQHRSITAGIKAEISVVISAGTSNKFYIGLSAGLSVMICQPEYPVDHNRYQPESAGITADISRDLSAGISRPGFG